MSLDDQLRSALIEEADMRSTPLPDIERMISGGRARRRRRNLTRLGAATAAVVLVGGGAYGGTQIGSADPRTDPDIAEQPSDPATGTPRPYRDTDSVLPESGTYRKLVGIDEDSGAPIEADLTFRSPEWYSGTQPVLSESDESSSVGLGVLEARTLAGGPTGCTVSAWEPEHMRVAAQTAEAVARQLTRLPRSTVTRPPTPTEAFGYEAVRLGLRVDGDCGSEIYLLAEGEAEAGGAMFGISYSTVQKVLMDVLVVDVGGSPIIVALWQHPDASHDLVEEATRVRDSISFVVDE